MSVTMSSIILIPWNTHKCRSISRVEKYAKPVTVLSLSRFAVARAFRPSGMPFASFSEILLDWVAMRLDDFDYRLPEDCIAQHPLADRSSSRMLLMDRLTGGWEDRQFTEFADLLRGDELLVLNNARVIPARLFGRRLGIRSDPPSKATRFEHLRTPIEVLLAKQLDAGVWEALVRPGRKIRLGERICFGAGVL